MEYYFFPWLKLEKRERGREKACKREIAWYSVLLRRVQRQITPRKKRAQKRAQKACTKACAKKACTKGRAKAIRKNNHVQRITHYNTPTTIRANRICRTTSTAITHANVVITNNQYPPNITCKVRPTTPTKLKAFSSLLIPLKVYDMGSANA